MTTPTGQGLEMKRANLHQVYVREQMNDEHIPHTLTIGVSWGEMGKEGEVEVAR